MALTKYKLGELLEQCDERNSEQLYSIDDVKGISTSKAFIDTKANMDGVSLLSYKIVNPNEFVYVADTSRRGDKIALAFNTTENRFIISAIYTVFRVSKKDILLSDYLFIFFNRPEFDRYSRFNSWGSARETFDWDTLCDIEISLPPIEIQQKYVAIYKAMLANQQSYERGLEDLKLVCDAYIEDLRRKSTCEKIGQYIRECNEKNTDGLITLAQGVTVDMVFTEPKRTAEDKESCRIVRNGQFAYNKVMKSNGTKLPIALRNGQDCVVSGSYQVFEVSNKEKLNPEYLMLWLSRPETQRHAGFDSWGSTRDVFSFDNMCDVEIPIPNIEIQRSVANIYKVYMERKQINEQLKAQIKNICPILIRGAIEEREI